MSELAAQSAAAHHSLTEKLADTIESLERQRNAEREQLLNEVRQRPRDDS